MWACQLLTLHVLTGCIPTQGLEYETVNLGPPKPPCNQDRLATLRALECTEGPPNPELGYGHAAALAAFLVPETCSRQSPDKLWLHCQRACRPLGICTGRHQSKGYPHVRPGGERKNCKLHSLLWIHDSVSNDSGAQDG